MSPIEEEAISLLRASEVDWDKVKSIGDLRDQLNL